WSRASRSSTSCWPQPEASGDPGPRVPDLQQRAPGRAQRVSRLAVEPADRRVEQVQLLQPLERAADLVAARAELLRNVARRQRESRRKPGVQLEHTELVAAQAWLLDDVDRRLLALRAQLAPILDEHERHAYATPQLHDGVDDLVRQYAVEA